MTNRDSSRHRVATELVHAGQVRTPYGETTEALFLTSGFVYDDAEQAEATFTGAVTRYQYSRFDNPTVAALEARLARIEGAEACRCTASGMAAASRPVRGATEDTGGFPLFPRRYGPARVADVQSPSRNAQSPCPP